MSGRGALTALTCVCLAAGLSACGGSSTGSTSSPTATSSGATAPAAGAGSQGEPKVSAGAPDAAAARAGKGSEPQGRAAAPSQGPSSSPGNASKKGAAGFIVAGGDNSIPTYGSESSSQEQTEAAEALTAYLKARAGADWGSACSQLGAPVRSQVEILAAAAGGEESKGCAAALAKITEKAPEEEREDPFSGRLAAFRVKGEHAFALFYGPRQQQLMMPMVSEGGGWRMGMFAPVPYPPGVPGGE